MWRKSCMRPSHRVWWISGRWDLWSGWAAPPGDLVRSNGGSYHCSSWCAASHRAESHPKWAQWHLTQQGWFLHLEQATTNTHIDRGHNLPQCASIQLRLDILVEFDIFQCCLSPFSTLVRSLPCFTFSNKGWWPLISSPVSLHDLSNKAPSPQGAVLKIRREELMCCWPEKREEKKRKYFLPDVEVKGNVWFNLQLVFLCWLKYAVLVAILVFKDLAVEKPERKE